MTPHGNYFERKQFIEIEKNSINNENLFPGTLQTDENQIEKEKEEGSRHDDKDDVKMAEECRRAEEEEKNKKEEEEYLLSEYIDQKALHLAAGELCHQIKSNQIKSNQINLH